jgi:hypothetical protein
MAPQEQKEISDEELWKTIPFEKQIEIYIAIDKGSKAEAVNGCMCFGKGFTLLSAMSFIERR